MSGPSTPVQTQDRADGDSDPEYKQDISAGDSASSSDGDFPMPKLVSPSASDTDSDASDSDASDSDVMPLLVDEDAVALLFHDAAPVLPRDDLDIPIRGHTHAEIDQAFKHHNWSQ